MLHTFGLYKMRLILSSDGEYRNNIGMILYSRLYLTVSKTK